MVTEITFKELHYLVSTIYTHHMEGFKSKLYPWELGVCGEVLDCLTRIYHIVFIGKDNEFKSHAKILIPRIEELIDLCTSKKPESCKLFDEKFSKFKNYIENEMQKRDSKDYPI